ncbi:MAG: hypothetical protein ACOH2J_04840 [Allorhizobium sp.]
MIIGLASFHGLREDYAPDLLHPARDQYGQFMHRYEAVATRDFRQQEMVARPYPSKFNALKLLLFKNIACDAKKLRHRCAAALQIVTLF